jgi:phage terminase large subunit GpA-like protein
MDVDIGGEGDPGQIARGRGETFDDLVVLEGSTPAKPPGIDPIDVAYERSSKAKYHVPCPFCSEFQPFHWKHPFKDGEYMLKFDVDPITKKVIPESVHYRCLYCGERIDEKHKYNMIVAGKWVHERPEITDILGYHITSLYLVAKPNWVSLAQEWVDAQSSPSKLRSFVHLRLAECWEERGLSVSPNWLRELADQEPLERGTVPHGTALLIITCDVQTGGGGRLEAQVVAWTWDEKAVLVDHQIFMGDPLQPDCWADFDVWRLRGWRHEGGATMTAHLVLVDSSDGGTQDAVYGYCQPRASAWVFPLKGLKSITAAGFAQESQTRNNTIRLFLVPSDVTKQAFYGRLAQPKGKGRCIVLPQWVTDEYLQQCTAEKRVKQENTKTGGITYVWLKTRDRNEGLDLWSYQIAGWWIVTKILAPHLGGPDGESHLRELARQASESREVVSYTAPSGRRVRNAGI